ncbi:MAG: 4-(cytidine 5'-diphospho)-2-C-methyl-D-erythritol kinase [Verrucomicrobiae bacterium]|nr:4-(cytidine 5'-diphospho)-2-C-methyl-D-erythritol kinase [Verrucomicrobiae bacterium]
MRSPRPSPCKINLVLNILDRRPDGFHELETLLLPVPLCDEITLEPARDAVELTCSNPEVPTDGTNLVVRAANAFFEQTGDRRGLRIHLEKRIPMAAGLGGGSSNAATTLLALNELCGHPLAEGELAFIAAQLGSDVPFFLQPGPAIGIGRGEQLQAVPSLRSLDGLHLLLIHPGFGVSTPWAYRHLAAFPEALHGRPGRAGEVAALLGQGERDRGLAGLFNSLETPVFDKYPVLRLYQEFLREHGALAAMMSGSGSTTFAFFDEVPRAATARSAFVRQFGETCWTAIVPATGSPATPSR